MSLTYDRFLELHPQFGQCSEEMITQAIQDAAPHVSVSEFGETYDLALRMKVCHILAIEMYGQQASIKGGETTVYETKFKQLQRMKIGGGMVL